jgi:hypothetical protein
MPSISSILVGAFGPVRMRPHASRKTRRADPIGDQPVDSGTVTGNRRVASAIALVHVMWCGVAMVMKVSTARRRAHIMVPMIVAIGLFCKGKA